MEVLLENITAYGFLILLSIIIIVYYYKRISKQSRDTSIKLEKARESGLHEPVSLHPVVDHLTCIGSGACIAACPEKDVLGLINGQAHLINASRCVGHGACFHACPLQAITLCIGTENRGVELPHLSPEFETNITGIYIAGELGGMGLIKNAVAQGKQAMENIAAKIKKDSKSDYNVIIIGAGPAGISASLTAYKNKLKFRTIEQDSIGGSVFNFPRSKIVMTSPMDLPLYGKIKLAETDKSHLLELWNEVLSKNKIIIHENEKAEKVEIKEEYFRIKTSKGEYSSDAVLLCIGRRGTPRKLGIKGENKEKVAYRLIEPELIEEKKVFIVGGGDSAVEAALQLIDRNSVHLSYRGSVFTRLKEKNSAKLSEAVSSGKINVLLNSYLVEIMDDKVEVAIDGGRNEISIPNDLVYIFAGGELPSGFLESIGIKIQKKFGEAILKHN